MVKSRGLFSCFDLPGRPAIVLIITMRMSAGSVVTMTFLLSISDFKLFMIHPVEKKLSSRKCCKGSNSSSKRIKNRTS